MLPAFAGRPVDLVGKEDVREDRPRDEPGLPHHGDGRADEMGRCRVRRELDALERDAEDLRHRVRKHRLGDTRRSLEQDVPGRDRRNEQQVDDAVVADDHLPDLRVDVLAELGEGGRLEDGRIHRAQYPAHGHDGAIVRRTATVETYG